MIGSNKKAWWQCKKGHEWETVISHRQRGSGCPICSGHKVLAGYNDLETTNPYLAKQWHPTKNGKQTPKDFTKGSKKRAWWICKEGHEWEAPIYSRNAGFGCPYCASQKVLVGFNDLETLDPLLATQWHPTKNGAQRPCNFMCKSNKKVWWICEKGHEWQAVINSRNSGQNCPYCANQKVLVGYNDLATTNPGLAAQWHSTKNGGKTPKSFTAGANKKAWWQCEQGHEWEAIISSRNRGRGCPYCAKLLKAKK